MVIKFLFINLKITNEHAVFCCTAQRSCIYSNSAYNLSTIKPTDKLIYKVISYETLHVSGSFSAHHQGFPTVHSAQAQVIQF